MGARGGNVRWLAATFVCLIGASGAQSPRSRGESRAEFERAEADLLGRSVRFWSDAELWRCSAELHAVEHRAQQLG